MVPQGLHPAARRRRTAKERLREFWKVRFEGNNYRTKLWLNGKQIAYFTGYFPFEVLLKNLKKGRNTLVAEVSSLRSNSDLTHWRPAAFNGYGTGGWWNFGGILREVYMRRVDTVDVEDVHVLPRLRRVGGAAKVEVRTTLRNFTKRDRDVSLVLRVDGRRIRYDPETVPALGRRELTNTVTIKKPRLWAPRAPELYGMTVGAVADRKERSTYRLTFGVKKIDVRPGGVILLNGKRLNLRGASVMEDDRVEGGALSQRTRDLLLNRLKNLGATVTRSQYPMHPAFLEALDRAGIMYWVDAPVYQIPNSLWGRAGVRSLAQRAATLMVKNNLNHPSILTWSLAVEPAAEETALGAYAPGFVSYVRDASHAIREMDDTHLVGFDRQSRIGEPLTTPAHQYLDVLGVNDYFGWYRSVIDNRPDLPPSTTADLSTLPRPGPRGEPGPAARHHRVRRRGVALRAGRAEGHLRVPAQVRARPPRDPLVEAVRERLDPLGAARLPRAPDLAGRRAGRVRHAAVAQQEPDRGEQPPEAGVPRRARSCSAAPSRCYLASLRRP